MVPFKVEFLIKIHNLEQKRAMLNQMNVRGLLFDPYKQHSDMLPIWVGKSEASAISFALEKIAPPRPMTHDLMKTMLDNMDAKVISTVITDLKDNTYFAKIHLLFGDSEFTVDSRPSDAIAVALRTDAPIFASGEVLHKQNSEELERWLENLKPEDFGKSDA
jgi:bifunctional DNase/RNase